MTHLQQALTGAVAIAALLLWWGQPRPIAVEHVPLPFVEPRPDIAPIDGPRLTHVTPRRPAPRRTPRAPEPHPPLVDEPPPPDRRDLPSLPAAPSAMEIGRWHAGGLPDVDAIPAPTMPPVRVYDEGVGTRLLEEGLRDGDSDLGLAFPGAGNLARAIAGAVRSYAPPRSSARFLAHVGSDGRVSSVRALSYRDGRKSAWRDAARSAERALAGSRFALRSGLRGGANVTVDVTSNVELPSGAERDHHIPHPTPPKSWRWPWLPAPGPRLSWREEGSWTPLPPDTARIAPAPETTFAPCDPAEPTCPGGTFDLADIGAHPTRIVRTSVDVAPSDRGVGPLRSQEHAEPAPPPCP